LSQTPLMTARVPAAFRSPTALGGPSQVCSAAASGSATAIPQRPDGACHCLLCLFCVLLCLKHRRTRPSVDGAPRLSNSEVYGNNRTYNTPLPGIPALPISWGDAYRLLRNLTGLAVPALWQGGLNFT
jgi:hypothetical protein